ncbi:MAG: peptidase T [Ruminococcaceae bacterium]|nr:peptidase T [Oscillospiraceae bacterium]
MDVIERFLKYVSFDTRSDENSTTVPSTEKQKVLGAYLAKELETIGLCDACMDEYGYVYAVLPATKGCENLPTVGLIAHMDTSPDVSGANVKPQIVSYTGGDIPLGESGEAISAALFPTLSRYVGQELIVTDGTTLLGADDKAGLAEIVSACEYLLAHPEIAHGRIAVGFTPDEEIGSGADHFDLARFGADYAYTVDGGELGEIEYENFNAASAKLTVKGVNIHPGSAKNRMKNALLMANEFVSLLPSAETPAHTEGYEGFYHVHDMQGNESEATVSMLIRDHDRASFENRKQYLHALVDFLNQKFGDCYCAIEIRDSYYNMKEKILPHMYLIEDAKAAMQAAGVAAEIIPIRGGTDGARLSYMGLPCPNLCTGGANFHGIHEFIPVESLRKMVEILVCLIRSKECEN